MVLHMQIDSLVYLNYFSLASNSLGTAFELTTSNLRYGNVSLKKHNVISTVWLRTLFTESDTDLCLECNLLLWLLIWSSFWNTDTFHEKNMKVTVISGRNKCETN